MGKHNINRDRPQQNEDKGVKDMGTFTEFLEKNKEKIRKVAESNTVRNEEGFTVIKKNDEWRKECEWDEVYKCLKKS